MNPDLDWAAFEADKDIPAEQKASLKLLFNNYYLDSNGVWQKRNQEVDESETDSGGD